MIEPAPTVDPVVTAGSPHVEVISAYDDPAVLVRTTDLDTALTLARRAFDELGLEGGRLVPRHRRLWRWIPVPPACGYDYTRMLHPWDSPGRGAFAAIVVDWEPGG